MKKYLFIVTLLLPVLAFTQLRMPSTTTAEWNRLMELSSRVDDLKPEEYANYPVYTFSNGLYLSMLGQLNAHPHWQEMLSQGVIHGSTTGRVATIKVPLRLLAEIDFSLVFSYLEMAERVVPDLNNVVVDVHADSVQHGWGLPSAFTGKDVLIGVTDWGFDYTHPMFYDTLYQATRIVAAWDQYKNVGDHPAGFSYGVEYDTPEELLAAQSDTANIYSYSTHGTHVAGIAGGSGATLPYRGLAPEAGFLFTTFLVDNASVLDAWNWMKGIATSQNKRLVVNMSWGLHYVGTLDGNSLLSQAIDQLSEEGVVFVTSGGNNGDVNFHIKKSFNNDAMISRVQFYPYSANAYMWGESISMWGEENHPFSAGISVHNNLNVLLDATPLYNTANVQSYLDSMIIVGVDTIFFNLATDASHPLNNRPHMRLRVKNTNTNLKVMINASAVDGIVHFWNIVELDNGVGNWGQEFQAFGTLGIGGDSQYGIAEPACASSAIAVAAYSASYINAIGTLTGGQIATFTSTGPLITEVIKPDIAAPGVNVISSISAFTDANYAAVSSTTFNGVVYDFAKFSGTSMSSPCVAGVVALMLDANPLLTPAQVKQIIQATARLDNYTGTIVAPGHPRWGMGKINAMQAVIISLETVGLGIDNTEMIDMLLSPNPASHHVNFTFNEYQTPLTVFALDLSGKRTALATSGNSADISDLAAGYYVIEVNTVDGTARRSLIVH